MMRIGLRRRIGRFGVLALVIVGAASVSGAGLAVVPSDGDPLALFPVTINADTGDQYDPHVDGDIVSYTSGDTVRYYNFFTGDDFVVLELSGATDRLSDVSNGKISFSREEATGRSPILVYDIGPPGTTTEIDLQETPLRTDSAIGADTVAFLDLGLAVEGELVVSELGGATQQVTNDTRIDRSPSVTPLGDRVVFESCADSAANCDIHVAGKSGGVWVASALTNSPFEHDGNPDSDGTFVVYDSNRSGERDIFWQPVGGGTEQQLELTGVQRNPSISDGVIVYDSIEIGQTAADLWVYEIATERRFRITTTPGDESLNDITTLLNGDVRVVWSSGATGSRDVFGATFTLPPLPPPPTYTFGGFLQPVDPFPTFNSMKAGAAVPVRFSLGGDFGLNIFETEFPKSDAITCNSGGTVDGIEETTSAGGSSLSYDTLTNTYKYIWKTDKRWAGCRQLVLKFADGSTQRANFTFK